MTLGEYIMQFTEEEWNDIEDPKDAPKKVWNIAIQSAMEECQKEIDALTRSRLLSRATGAQGCKNAIERLLEKDDESNKEEGKV